MQKEGIKPGGHGVGTKHRTGQMKGKDCSHRPRMAG